jgi:hypothetical protein
VAASGPELPWTQLYTVATEQGERFMAVPTGTQFSVVGATAKLPAQYSSFTVLVVHLLDENLARVLSEHTGLPVRILNYRAFNATPVNEFTLAALAGAGRRPFRRAAHRSAGAVRLELSDLFIERRGHRADRDARFVHRDRPRREFAGVAADPHRGGICRAALSRACCWAGA